MSAPRAAGQQQQQRTNNGRFSAKQTAERMPAGDSNWGLSTLEAAKRLAEQQAAGNQVRPVSRLEQAVGQAQDAADRALHVVRRAAEVLTAHRVPTPKAETTTAPTPPPGGSAHVGALHAITQTINLATNELEELLDSLEV